MAEKSRGPLKDFEERWKLWAGRSPKTSPEEAAQQILARLLDRTTERHLATWWRVVLPAAALVVLAIALGILWKPYPTTSTARSLAPSSVALDENTALIWLDPETPLYLALPEPEAPRGEEP